jgi:DNA invertase Pin-like site-specific DNA recombinase
MARPSPMAVFRERYETAEPRVYDRRKYTDRQIARIHRLAKSGMSQRAIADKLGMSKTTVLRYLKADV